MIFYLFGYISAFTDGGWSVKSIDVDPMPPGGRDRINEAIHHGVV